MCVLSTSEMGTRTYITLIWLFFPMCVCYFRASSASSLSSLTNKVVGSRTDDNGLTEGRVGESARSTDRQTEEVMTKEEDDVSLKNSGSDTTNLLVSRKKSFFREKKAFSQLSLHIQFV